MALGLVKGQLKGGNQTGRVTYYCCVIRRLPVTELNILSMVLVATVERPCATAPVENH